jgi:hypothetical protein
MLACAAFIPVTAVCITELSPIAGLPRAVRASEKSHRNSSSQFARLTLEAIGG